MRLKKKKSIIMENWGRRSVIDRRQVFPPLSKSERRNCTDRRSGKERRKGPDRRNSEELLGNKNIGKESRSGYDRRSFVTI